MGIPQLAPTDRVEIDRLRVNTLKAAEIAGVTERTIFNWMRLGWVEFTRTASGQPRIYADTLLKPHGR